eukprot:CAMPEP_0197703554 /NCGR_PEP_ID=MMETSP1338-20131121/125494_1 /TAXON_ID=43686 ORGANISM="Pelagodinium beii, Strain RCC1491" /NCGR_SAMPLE_ID=MMETSP1338 /ASSEMBLY_ACC=CAM_ASM_000754 /LENGTH=634 /DNA_ID=CAMNT_0043287451 /DNA_START=67 /DNA_END=1972 /DNA_ORIENTATION=-
MACVHPTDQAIVVGGGLGGVSAANTLLECGMKVVLLDKSSFCGGNSSKATSGINGAETRTQKEKGIPDTVEIFTQDTLKGGAKRPAVARVLCANSGPDVDWLMDKFSLDLSLLARLGGHSQPRTHRGKERFPGMTITYALIQSLEAVVERTDLARLITKARVTDLITKDGICVGCTYEKAGQNFKEFGPVILATGGFGADFGSDSLLAKYRPDLLHLPTTNGEHCTGDGIKMSEEIGAKTIDLEWVQVNGEHCTGDGIKMSEEIGAKTIDLEWVQVHPTGLVKPDEPDAKVKFLAAEALRGVGGIILNANGDRFCNELGRRDYVTGEMWKSKPPFRLCLNKKASDEIIWHCKHYTGRGVMKAYASGAELAKDMGIPVSKLEEVHEAHFQASKNAEKDPEGGKWPAYPSGKSWDDASGPTGSGKKYYHNVIPGSQVSSEPFHVAIITPVIHYCMGGVEVNEKSECIGGAGAIPGLYAAGEVAGGVHGNNRLGGNSLLDCVVFGRVAAKEAAAYALGAPINALPQVDLAALKALPAKKGPAPEPAKVSSTPAPAATATTGNLSAPLLDKRDLEAGAKPSESILPSRSTIVWQLNNLDWSLWTLLILSIFFALGAIWCWLNEPNVVTVCQGLDCDKK